ncbi:hypothetical protein HB818_14650 [Listeria booriae]|uniref:hypothetical protein n=1 Tax=Listeria booriae TaxID=1552123 RepID=UPI00162515D7|nr:hypothetical protein [Listeria booriae]MBC1286999.1 hypothetical protein [Listeria booriae]
MDISDVIQIIATFITGITAIISVIIAVKSLQITQKSIEDANKPVVVCYLDIVDVGFYKRYFIIKNFGRTPAKIMSMSFQNLQSKIGRNNLESLNNTIIAPNQKFVVLLDDDYTNKDNFSVTICYEDLNGNHFKELFSLNPSFSKDISYAKRRSTAKSEELNDLTNMHHSVAKKNL